MSPLSPQRAVLRALGALFFYLSVPALALGFMMILLSFASVEQMPDQLTSLISSAGYVMALWYIWRKMQKSQIPLDRMIGSGLRTTDRRSYLLLGVSGFAIGLAVAALLTLLPLSVEQRSAYDAAALASFTGSDRLLAILLAMVFSPLSEELFFRGVMLRTLRRGLSVWPALLVSSVCFGLLHLQPLWVLYASCMGLLFGWVALYTDNLGAAVALHFGFNLSSLPGVLASGSVWYRALGSNLPLLWMLMLIGGTGGALLLRVVLKEKNHDEYLAD